MKTIKHIKEKVTDYQNLYQANLHAQRCKRFQPEVLEFSANLEENLHDLQEELINPACKKPAPRAGR